MRILYLVNARIPTPRAYGLQIMKTCEAFAAAGAQVELVVPTRNFKSPEDPFMQYGIKHRFTFTTIPVRDFLHWEAPGFLLSTILFSEKIRWMKSFWDADVIYSRDPLLLAQYLLLGRTLVFEAHRKPTFAARLVARRAKRVVVISHGLREAYEAAGVSKEKIIVAPDAVDTHFFDGVLGRAHVRTQLGLPAEGKIILYAGHLYPRKGAGVLAEASTKIPGALFVFVGGSPHEVEAFRKQWGSAANVRIVGHVSHKSVPLYLRSADLLVIPNSGKDEDSARFTSPMKLFEYIASGTPIIASDLPSLREILTEDTAYFVAADDAEALAKGIHTALGESVVAHEKAAKALALAEKFSWENRVKSILPGL